MHPSETKEPGFLRKRWDALKALVKQQLLQGVSPDRLAAAAALGITLDTFPILGLTTLLCVILGYSLRLNQPLIQATSYLAAPLQFAMIPLFLNVGERVFSQPPLPFSPSTMMKGFYASPAQFLNQYGKAGVLAVFVWVFAAPVLFAAVFYPCRWWFRKIDRAVARRREKA